jgi:hypothetical protein
VNLSKFRRVEPSSEPSKVHADSVPDGYVPIAATVYFNKEKRCLTITGQPCEGADLEAEIHNCDANGCRWEHVIARIVLTEYQAKQFEICKEPKP